MIHEDGEDPFEMLLIQDQQPVLRQNRCGTRATLPQRIP
jgi:hypothetical protein